MSTAIPTRKLYWVQTLLENRFLRFREGPQIKRTRPFSYHKRKISSMLCHRGHSHVSKSGIHLSIQKQINPRLCMNRDGEDASLLLFAGVFVAAIALLVVIATLAIVSLVYPASLPTNCMETLDCEDASY